jgi:hypothetical protein
MKAKREKTYRVKLYWEMCAEVEVKATSKKAAIQAAIDGPLPSCDIQEYVSDSANVDPMDVSEVSPPEITTDLTKLLSPAEVELTHKMMVEQKLDGWRPPNRDNW